MKLIFLPRGCFRETNFYTTGREKGGDHIQYMGYDYGFKMEKAGEVSENWLTLNPKGKSETPI